MKLNFLKSNTKFLADLEQSVYLMPLWQKLVICLIAFAAPCVAFWFLFLAPRLQELDTISGKIPKLKQEVRILQEKAKTIPQLEAELKEMDKVLKKALKLLPESKDIPAILTEISSLGNEEHLDFLSFSPGGEVKKDFYAEIPVRLSIRGPFHSTMRFFDKVSRMARIVHIRNVSMGGAKKQREIWSQTASSSTPSGSKAVSAVPASTSNNSGGEVAAEDRGPVWIINTSCTAVTYRFLTEAEQKARAKKGKARKRRRRR